MMRIGLLPIGSRQFMGGVNYVISLAKALKAWDKDGALRLTLLADGAMESELYDEILRFVEVWPSPGGSTSRGLQRVIERSIKRLPKLMRFLQGRAIRFQGIDVLYPCVASLGARFPVPWIGWIWDLQHRRLPDLFSAEERARRDQAITQILSDAPRAVVSSQDSLKDLREFFPNAHCNVDVLHFRTVPDDAWYEGDINACRAKYRIPERYLLVANQFWVHKNHRTAFRALAALSQSRPDAHLVCTGSTRDPRHPDYFDELECELRELGLTERVSILDVIPRIDQIQLMRGAQAVLQPSLFEGWSTVVEDARAMGKRLFLSDVPIHREQDPPDVVYFDPHSHDDLAKRLDWAWPELVNGPDRERENRARADQVPLVFQYAEDLMGIVRKARDAFA